MRINSCVKFSSKENMDFCPFKHNSSVQPFIPPVYRSNKDMNPDYTWFNTAPSYSVFRVNTLTTTSEDVISFLQSYFEKQEKLYGCQTPVVFEHKLLQGCIIIGSWKIESDLSTPDPSKGEVIVDVPCACAVLRGAHVFAPGILGLPFDVKEGSPVNVYADISGKCTRGLSQKFQKDKLFVGEGILRMDRHKLFDNNIKAYGIAVEISRALSGVPSFDLPENFGILQNLPSVLCSHVLQVQSDHRVLDMCAAPGNKTIHIANLMQNLGTIIALDKTKDKIEQIIAQCKKFGITNVTTHAFNSTMAASEDSEQFDAPPFKHATFDRVLLDAPCSALGKRPQLNNNMNLNQLKSYACLQKKLLYSGIKLLKPGGILVYSTCTITVEENEDVVSWALNKFSDIELCKAEPTLGHPGIYGVTGLTEEQTHCLQRFGPTLNDTPEEDTVGFFIAKFRKT